MEHEAVMHPQLENEVPFNKSPENCSEKTLSSSFKGVHHYTGKRGSFSPSALEWLETKSRDDSINPQLWRVHDKLYNLEGFIDRHPGGRDWIELTRGCDITEAFESSHFVNISNVEKTLAKFYVEEAKSKRNSPYSFAEDGFYKTLKRKAEPILQKVGMGPSKEAVLIQDALALSYIIFAISGAMLESTTLLVIAGTLLGMTIGCAHNFFHKKDNWRTYYWDLSTLSSFEWRISHAISHHNFPNTILDYEILIGEPFIEMLPIRPKTFFHKYIMQIGILVVYATLGFVQLAYRFLRILQGKQKLRPENLLVIFELIAFLIISPSLWSGFSAWAITATFSVFWLTFTGNNSAHHHPQCFHDGDESRPNPDYGLCQIDATAYKTDWYHQPLLSVLTTYGEHPLHHLFPTVCHGKLKYLKPILNETLDEFSEHLLEFTQWQILKGTHQQLGRTKVHALRKNKKH